MRTALLLYLRPANHRQTIAAKHRARLRALGLRLVSADDEPDPRDAAFFDDVLALPPQEEVGRVHDALLRYARDHRVDAVVAQTEAALLPGALLIRSLSLPGIGVDAAHACVNKVLSRLTLANAGVPVPRFCVASDASDVRAFVDGHGYPVVLKAAASSMSRLVTLVRGAEDVEPAVAAVLAGLRTHPDVRRLCTFAAVAGANLHCDPERQFLVESFAAGTPVETDGLVVGDRPFTLGVTEQVMFPPPRFYISGYQFPADLPESRATVVEAVSDRALRAAGVRDAGFSIEMRERDGEVVVIEVNARLGQDDGFAELFAPATGAEPLVHAIAIAAGGAPAIRRERAPPRGLAFRCSFVDGVVRGVPPASAIAALAACGIEAGVGVTEGTRLFAPPHPEAYPHLAWAIASHPRSSRAAFEAAADAVTGLEFRVA
jgi:biotin carboxylase